MSKFRIVSEGIHVVQVGGQPMPARRMVTVWRGSELPNVDELRALSAGQPDIDAQSAEGRLADRTATAEALASVLGNNPELQHHWPLVVQRRRTGGILGYSSLGTVQPEALLTATDIHEALTPPEHISVFPRWGDLSPELQLQGKEAVLTLIGFAAVTGAIIYASGR